VALNLDSKKVVVDEVAQYAAKALSVVAAEYRGLTVSEMTELRNKAREANVYLRVVKNSLAKRAIEGTEFECVKDGLKGPLIMAFSMEAPGAAARIISDFAKENNKLIPKVIGFDGQSLDIAELARLASLPTRDEGISLIMAVMKAPVGKLARTLAALRDQKQESEAEAA